MTAKILDGKKIADGILVKVKQQTAALKDSGWPPKLTSIKIGDNPAIDLYIRNQRLKAEQVGVEFEEREYSKHTSIKELIAAIYSLNVDPRVTGIILQRPIPRHLPLKDLQKAIHPLKDVEGMHPASIGNIIYNELELAPCTAMAAVELLKYTHTDLPGCETVIIGHSEIVGRPIAFILTAAGATVTICHHMTRDVSLHTRRADAVFVAVGKANLVTADMLKPGAVLIDIGINEAKSATGGPTIVGDSDYDSCAEVAGWITPVPGGVGPMTVAILMRNTLIAAERLKGHYEARLKFDLK